MYGRHRIFSFTWELYPTETPSDATDHYSPDEIIARETKRNRAAFLYALRMAGCPYGAIDRQRANCGAFFDDFEGSKGWAVNPDGTDTAIAGRWQRGIPARPRPMAAPSSWTRPPPAPRARHRGSSGASTGANDLDGTTTIRSARHRPAGQRRGRSRSATTSPTAPNASPDDWFRVWVEAADGTRTLVREELGAAERRRRRLGVGPGRDRPVGRADGADRHRRPPTAARDSLVEAAVDDVRIERPVATASAPRSGPPAAASRPRAGVGASRRSPESKNPGGRAGVLDVDIRLGCGEGIRTLDLRVMSPTSCRCSTPQAKYEPGRPSPSNAVHAPGRTGRAPPPAGPGRRPAPA